MPRSALNPIVLSHTQSYPVQHAVKFSHRVAPSGNLASCSRTLQCEDSQGSNPKPTDDPFYQLSHSRPWSPPIGGRLWTHCLSCWGSLRMSWKKLGGTGMSELLCAPCSHHHPVGLFRSCMGGYTYKQNFSNYFG